MAKPKGKKATKRRAAKKAPARSAAPSSPPPLGSSIAKAYADYRALQEVDDDGYEHLRKLHLAAAHLWHLRSDEAYFEGNHDGARKASMTAEGHAKLAAKLARDSVVDRVAKLEALVRERRDFGAELEKLGD